MAMQISHRIPSISVKRIHYHRSIHVSRLSEYIAPYSYKVKIIFFLQCQDYIFLTLPVYYVWSI